MLRTSKLIAIRDDGCILLARKRKNKQYSLPGGKALRGETAIRTLRREIGEELPDIRIGRVRRWRKGPRFKGKRATFYFARAKGTLKVGHEIDRGAWIREWWKLKLSRSARRTLELLVIRGHLKRWSHFFVLL
jgi:8-oxo-dGTP diphosphatase